MAGHSKWANIKHRKNEQDAVRSKVFAKLSKEIIVATALGGDDVDSNPALRLAIAKAKAKSMPKKNIETAIAKAIGNDDNSNYKEIVYGGNLAGVSFLIVYLSDNANRVAANIKSIFKKANGNLLGSSSVKYIFSRKGILELPDKDRNEDKVMMLALEAGAEDFEHEGNSFFIYTNQQNFATVKKILEKNNLGDFKTAEVRYEPNQEIYLPKEKALKILDFIEKLDDDDDVQDVFHNLDPCSIE